MLARIRLPLQLQRRNHAWQAKLMQQVALFRVWMRGETRERAFATKGNTNLGYTISRRFHMLLQRLSDVGFGAIDLGFLGTWASSCPELASLRGLWFRNQVRAFWPGWPGSQSFSCSVLVPPRSQPYHSQLAIFALQPHQVEAYSRDFKLHHPFPDDGSVCVC